MCPVLPSVNKKRNLVYWNQATEEYIQPVLKQYLLLYFFYSVKEFASMKRFSVVRYLYKKSDVSMI
jgi:hypothetical protein